MNPTFYSIMQKITIKSILIIPVQMHLDVVQGRINFPRAISGLRAAHLNQQVVVTGGTGDECTMRDDPLFQNQQVGCHFPFN